MSSEMSIRELLTKKEKTTAEDCIELSNFTYTAAGAICIVGGGVELVLGNSRNAEYFVVGGLALFGLRDIYIGLLRSGHKRMTSRRERKVARAVERAKLLEEQQPSEEETRLADEVSALNIEIDAAIAALDTPEAEYVEAWQWPAKVALAPTVEAESL